MTDEDRYWLALWRIVAAGIISLATLITSCTAHQTYRISEAIKAGVDPITAKCALDRPDGGAVLICAKAIK